MSLKKSILALIGVLSLMIGSTTLAQDTIDTTVTVENSTPACTDTTPSSLTATDTYHAGSRVVGGASNSTQWRDGLGINMYVNTCSEHGWAVTATITDFTSGANTHPGSNFTIGGDAWYAGNVVNPSTGIAIPGTTGLAWGAAHLFSQPAGAGLWSPTVNISSGDAGATGAMYQGIRSQVRNIPWTLPAGEYSAEMTFTFTPTGP